MSNIETILMISVFFGLFVYLMYSCSITLKPYKTENSEKDWNIKSTQDTASWAAENNFDFLGFYNIQYATMRTFMAAWELKEKTYLCQYGIRAERSTVIARDIVTIFENGIEFTTSNTIDSNLRPKPPGHYSQSFSKCSFDELYRMHLESEEFLIARGGANVEKSQIGFEESTVNSLKKTNRHNLKHWYWIFLIFYFYFVRNKWHNKSIKEQYELGMIKLPNEIFLK